MRYRRTILPGGTYFFTVNLQDRNSILLTDKINELRFAFRKTLQYYPFRTEGIVILPDHLHMLMTLPLNDGDYSLRWNMIKGTFSKQIQVHQPISGARKNRREKGIWQKRFWEHLIRDETDFENHINYIHYNPVKHGYVSKPVAWNYSSIHHFIKQGVLNEHWTWNKEFNVSQFDELV